MSAFISSLRADDLKAMAGTWKPVSAELAGQSFPQPVLDSITLELNGADYKVTIDSAEEKAVDKGTVEIGSTVTPKQMTITGVEGPNAGRHYPAIYELAGDTLRVCYDLSGAKRPTAFKTEPKTMLYLVTYQRLK